MLYLFSSNLHYFYTAQHINTLYIKYIHVARYGGSLSGKFWLGILQTHFHSTFLSMLGCWNLASVTQLIWYIYDIICTYGGYTPILESHHCVSKIRLLGLLQYPLSSYNNTLTKIYSYKYYNISQLCVSLFTSLLIMHILMWCATQHGGKINMNEWKPYTHTKLWYMYVIHLKIYIGEKFSTQKAMRYIAFTSRKVVFK